MFEKIYGQTQVVQKQVLGVQSSSGQSHVCVCDPSTGDRPDDHARIDFVRTMHDELQFRLTNHSSQAIHFRAYTDKSKIVYPLGFQMQCKPSNSDAWDFGPFAVVDGVNGEAKIEPGTQVNLILAKVFRADEFVRQHVGGSCRVDQSIRIQGF